MVGDRSLPRIDIQNFDLHIDNSKIHIDLSGSILADVLDKIVFVFKSLIMGQISSVISKEVPKALQSAINGVIIQTNGFAPLV